MDYSKDRDPPAESAGKRGRRLLIVLVAVSILSIALLAWTLTSNRGEKAMIEPPSTQSTEGGDIVISAPVGEIIDIDLPSPASTGYKWELPVIPDGTELVDTSFSPPPPGTFGDSGVQHFHLRATRAGHFTLTFQLKRPWEAELSDTNVVELNIT